MVLGNQISQQLKERRVDRVQSLFHCACEKNISLI